MKKYIEIDGIKYKIDPADDTKALLDDKGEMILFVEDTPVDPPKDPVPPVKTPIKDDYTEDELIELAKSDPALARLLREKKELLESKRIADEKADEDRKAQMEKNGEFQKLAEEADEKAKKALSDKAESDALLDKYKGTVNEIRDEMLGQISDDKKSLIPDGSARKQIDYIRKNAAFLGVVAIKKGGGVPPNDDTPPLDEEGKLNKEFAELMAKENLTQTEKDRTGELSRLIKEIRSKKA